MDFPATFEEGGGGASEMDFPEIPEGGGWFINSTSKTEPKNDNEIFVMQKKIGGKTSGWLYVLGSRMSFFFQKCQNVLAT